MDKNMDWIYRPINEPDLENTLGSSRKGPGLQIVYLAENIYCHGDIQTVRRNNGENITGIIGGGCPAIRLHQ